MLMQLRRQVVITNWTTELQQWFASDSFDNQHWIGAHPDLVPTDVDPWCDLSRTQDGNYRYTDLCGSTGLRCRGFVWGPEANKSGILTNFSDHAGERLRDYFGFPQMIIRWFTFYGQGPADTSPIWTWYSDGDVWKAAVREHGLSAISMVADKYALKDIGRTFWTAFSNRTANGSAALPEGLLKVSKVPKERTIFFHVVLPLTVDPLYQTTIAALSNQLQLVAEALQNLTWLKTPVYYTLATRNVTNELGANDAVQITCKAHALDCIPLGDTVVHPDFAGETLWYVHQYCSANPSSSITYLSNVIPDVGGSPRLSNERN